jgi:hypothetical protein
LRVQSLIEIPELQQLTPSLQGRKLPTSIVRLCKEKLINEAWTKKKQLGVEESRFARMFGAIMRVMKTT